MTLFAGPPVAMYPTCVAATPDGAVFVGVDPNLAQDFVKGRGRVVRLGRHRWRRTRRQVHHVHRRRQPARRGVRRQDGVRDASAEPDGVLIDDNGDGIADVSRPHPGSAPHLDFRGADHTTNNIQLGPDGWLYVAVGDYGFIKATGTDGSEIQHRGGAVVRVRPDGSDLEMSSRARATSTISASIRSCTSSRATTPTMATAGTRACTTWLPAPTWATRRCTRTSRRSTCRRSPTTARARVRAACGYRIQDFGPTVQQHALHGRLDAEEDLSSYAEAEGRVFTTKQEEFITSCVRRTW